MRSSGALANPLARHATAACDKEHDTSRSAHMAGMKSTIQTPERSTTSFVSVERDLLRGRVGTVLRYHGGNDATVVIVDRGFEVGTAGFSTQTWTWADEKTRNFAATQAAQFVSNRIRAALI